MVSLDVLEIHNLLHQYAYLNDGGDFEGAARLFAQAIVYFPSVEESPFISDPAGLAAMWRRWVRIYPDTGTPRTQHVVSNVCVNFESSTRAKSKSSCLVYQVTPQFPFQPIIGVTYDDIFVRQGESWRFWERRSTLNLVGDVSAHLMNSIPERKYHEV